MPLYQALNPSPHGRGSERCSSLSRLNSSHRESVAHESLFLRFGIRRTRFLEIPAKAGIGTPQRNCWAESQFRVCEYWIPAFVGISSEGRKCSVQATRPGRPPYA